jgi:hypothetical protein
VYCCNKFSVHVLSFVRELHEYESSHCGMQVHCLQIYCYNDVVRFRPSVVYIVSQCFFTELYTQA